MNCFYCHKEINRIQDSHVIFVQDKSSKATHYTCTVPHLEKQYDNYLHWKNRRNKYESIIGQEDYDYAYQNGLIP